MLKNWINSLNYYVKKIQDYYSGMPVRSMIAASLAVGLLCAVMVSAADVNRDGVLGGDIIRLHVIANSDSDFDQQTKLKVRDAVLKYATPYLSQLDDGKSAKTVVTAHLEDIEKAASQELAALGVNQPVKAMLGVFDFPLKSYDNVTLPAGKYQAVRIVIGEGKGHNWWCVMFPPLCMVDAAHSESKDKSVKIIQQNMPDYDVMNGGEKRPAFRIGFKLFEIFGGGNKQQVN